MLENKKLRVIACTQQEYFFIPQNIIKASKVCDIIEVVDNNYKSSLDNKLKDLINWFGFFQCAKMAMLTAVRIAEGILDSISGFRLFSGECSIKHAAKKIGADFVKVPDINAESYLKHVKELAPDLIISYSAPQVMKAELLSIPKYGVINVHGALLPDYRGCLPSFWYLYNGEQLGGATVHYMSAKIDDGDIVEQGSVDISDCKSMFELMHKTKELGGNLMIKAIQEIAAGTAMSKKNDTANGSYFTWPTVEEAREFRARGHKLV